MVKKKTTRKVKPKKPGKKKVSRHKKTAKKNVSRHTKTGKPVKKDEGKTDKPIIGRPSLLTEVMHEKFIAMIAKGFTHQQAADVLGVTRRTITNWINRSELLRIETNEARLIASRVVEASLFNRAVGYSHPEEKVFCHEGFITTHDTIKHYPPDTTAAIFWLKNRRPDLWKDKRETELSGKVQGIPAAMTAAERMSDEDIENEIERVESQLEINHD